MQLATAISLVSPCGAKNDYIFQISFNSSNELIIHLNNANMSSVMWSLKGELMTRIVLLSKKVKYFAKV